MIDAATITATLAADNGGFFDIPDLESYAQKVVARGRSLTLPADGSTSPYSYVLFYENDTEVYVTMVWTQPERRGRGLAETLMRQLIHQSHKDVRLQVHLGNPALRLYRRLGFTQESVDGDTATLLRRRRVAVMQPYVFPYLGYFHLIEASDEFVFYDDVNFTKRGWINRNRILLHGDPHLFTVPLAGASQNRLIMDIPTQIDGRWRNAFAQTLSQSYRKAPNFEPIRDLVLSVIDRPHDSIADLAIDSVRSVYSYLGRPLDLRRSSDATPHTRGLDRSDRLIAITKERGFGAYVNAPGGAELYDRRYFATQGVELSFVQSEPVDYAQYVGHAFVPNLSIIDVLMFNSVERLRELLTRFAVA